MWDEGESTDAQQVRFGRTVIIVRTGQSVDLFARNMWSVQDVMNMGGRPGEGTERPATAEDRLQLVAGNGPPTQMRNSTRQTQNNQGSLAAVEEALQNSVRGTLQEFMQNQMGQGMAGSQS